MQALESAVVNAVAQLSARQDEIEQNSETRLESLLSMVSTIAGAVSDPSPPPRKTPLGRQPRGPGTPVSLKLFESYFSFFLFILVY